MASTEASRIKQEQEATAAKIERVIFMEEGYQNRRDLKKQIPEEKNKWTVEEQMKLINIQKKNTVDETIKSGETELE